MKKSAYNITICWRFLFKNGRWSVWYRKKAKTQNYVSALLFPAKNGYRSGELRVLYCPVITNEATFTNDNELRLALSAFLAQDLVDYLQAGR